jgi:hypothetical protein
MRVPPKTVERALVEYFEVLSSILKYFGVPKTAAFAFESFPGRLYGA